MTPALRDPLLPRRQWFELHDLPACPRVLRDGVTETLRVVATVFRIGRRIAPLVEEALRTAESNMIVDLCSGSGGPAVGLCEALHQRGTAVRVVLTDKYPNRAAFERARAESSGVVSGVDTSVDATAVPEQLEGVRTLFNSFHHFPPDAARAILADASHKRQPIAVFEFPERSVFATVASFPVCIAVALAVAPFQLSGSALRLFFTYVIPAVPFVFAFDGVVSHMRAYSADELETLTAGLDRDGYEWRTGKVRVLWPFLSVSYLLGIPGNKPDGECDTTT